jgi:RNA polymerase sigma-70 factor (ECF subfamily)
MSEQTTCWTLIRGAAGGGEEDVAAFVRLYAPVVRAYLRARWTSAPLRDDLEDAAQEVFVECFKDGGVLERADPAGLGSFRAFLLGVTRNISLRFEQRRGRKREIQPPTEFDPDRVPAEEEHLYIAFDRAWAQSLLKEAVARQDDRARILGAEAERRVELLRLRFREGLTLRDIAGRWQEEHGAVKRQNALALREFEEALREVVAFHYPGLPTAGERELARLLALVG